MSGRLNHIFTRDPLVLEVALAGFKIVWGLWFFNPHIFDNPSPGYRMLALLAPSWFWGMMMLTLGAVHMILVHQGTTRARALSACLGVAVFWAIAGLFGVGTIWTQGWVIFGWMGCLDLFVVRRLMLSESVQ